MDYPLLKRIFVFVLISITLCFLETKTYSYFYVKDDYIIAYSKYKWININIFSEIKYYATKYDLHPLLICAFVQRETRGDWKALGKDGEIGGMQPLPCHYNGNPNDLYEISTNLDVSCSRLKLAYIKAKGNIKFTAMYYNGGLNRKIKNYRRWKYTSDIVQDFNHSLEMKEIKFASAL
jgi:soluble lytic murein transglycosylase-like protein